MLIRCVLTFPLLFLAACPSDPESPDDDDDSPMSDAGSLPDSDSGSSPGTDGGTPDGGGTSTPGSTTSSAHRACEGSMSGQILTAGPSDYETVLDSMQPGDTLRLSSGTYDNGLFIADMNGSTGNCFVIEGPTSGDAAVFMGSSSFNTITIRDSSYVVVRNLELDGQGELGDGVKAEWQDESSYAHHIVLENLFIHDHDANQQVVGISTKCTAHNWVVRNVRIDSAGTGMYFGDSDGSAPFVNGLIENNLVVNTIGYNIQIKHQLSRTSLEGVPASATTIIRHNVFSKSDNSSGGELARPNLLVGHVPLSGVGIEDQYLIYGNFFYDNPVEALFQGEGNVSLYNNVFVNPSGDAINIVPHNDVPRRVSVYANTVLASASGITVSGGDEDFEQRVVGNAVFATTALEGGTLIDNTSQQYADAATYLEDPTSGLGAGLDLHPQAGQLELSFNASDTDDLIDIEVDFDRQPRDFSRRGAYAGPATGSSWALDLTLKP